MKFRSLIIVCLFFLFAVSLAAENSNLSAWSVYAAPTFFQPIVSGDFQSNDILKNSWGGSVLVEYDLNTVLPLSFRFGGHYSNAGLLPVVDTVVNGNLNELSLLAGVDLKKELSSLFLLRGFIDGGMTYGILSTGKAEFYAMAQAGIGLDIRISESLSTRLETSFMYKFGLTGGIGAGIGMIYRFPETARKSVLPFRNLDFLSIDVASIFPILRSQYEYSAVGTASIVNTGNKTMRNLRISFTIPQYMDTPRECMALEELKAGETVQVPLYVLLNDSILGITEPTRAGIQVIVESDGIEEIRSASVQVYDRNALTWSDDRKAAAFISSKDPWVLDLTGNIMAAVMLERNPELLENLQTAIAIHEGLRVFGISYMLSPNRPFAQSVIDTAAVDSLKFPRQTLGFRAGDCADLSVLYASCFEAAGIETALVTIPGHIFVAADLGISASQAVSRGMDLRDFIVREDRVWIPVETTMRNAAFDEVWRKGAEQWHNFSPKDQARIYPVHEAWTEYAPVGLPADGSAIQLPQSEMIISGFREEIKALVNRELSARLELLGPVEKGSANGRVSNSRGVLYAKYGLYRDAVREFEEAAAAGNKSAIVNLGNLAMVQSDPESAYLYYHQAVKLLPRNTRLQANLANAAAVLGKKEEAAQILDDLRKRNPQLADKYGNVVAQAVNGLSGTRAAAVDGSSVLWAETE